MYHVSESYTNMNGLYFETDSLNTGNIFLLKRMCLMASREYEISISNYSTAYRNGNILFNFKHELNPFFK